MQIYTLLEIFHEASQGADWGAEHVLNGMFYLHSLYLPWNENQGQKLNTTENNLFNLFYYCIHELFTSGPPEFFEYIHS